MPINLKTGFNQIRFGTYGCTSTSVMSSLNNMEKLSFIASDPFGASGKKIIEELMKGELKPEAMAELSKGRLRNRKAEMEGTLVGNQYPSYTSAPAAIGSIVTAYPRS